MATSLPSGYEHTHDALDYVDGWVANTDPSNRAPTDTERLNTPNFFALPL